MIQNFTTDVSQWQGVDDEPTAGSQNLVKSGGVQTEITKHKIDSTNYSYTIVKGIVSSTNKMAGTAVHTSILLVVKGGDVITVRNEETKTSHISFLKSFPASYKDNDSVDFSEYSGFDSRITFYKVTNTYTVPADTNYILITKMFGSDVSPDILNLNGINLYKTNTENLGEAVQSINTQLSGLQSYNSRKDGLASIKQLAEFTQNGYLKVSDGTIKADGNGKVSDFIQVTPGKEYLFIATRSAADYTAIAGYSSNNESSFVASVIDKTTIGNTDGQNATAIKVMIPDGINYVRVSYVDAYSVGLEGFWEIEEKGLLPQSVKEITAQTIGSYKSIDSYNSYKVRITGSNKWETGNSNKSVIVPVESGMNIKVKSVKNSTIAFLKTFVMYTNGGTPDYSSATGYTGKISVNNTNAEFTVPVDAKYLCIVSDVAGTDILPYSITIDGFDILKGLDGILKSTNGYSIWVGTQAEYDAISTHYDNVLYFIQ